MRLPLGGTMLHKNSRERYGKLKKEFRRLMQNFNVDEVEAGAKAALGGRSAAARPDAEQEKRIKQLERALGRSHLQIEILKNVLGE